MQTCFKSTPEGGRVEACFVKQQACLNDKTLYPNATWQTSYSYFVAGTQLNKLVSRDVSSARIIIRCYTVLAADINYKRVENK